MDMVANMRAFLAVARYGSFSEAARQLNVVPSVAAKRVSQLEHTVGSKLFERAAIRSRNTHVTMLYMHCLSRNSTMMHIAKKAGMKIEYAYGEADAYLTLPPADQSSIIAEMLQEQAAVFDYALKRQARQASKIFESFLPAAVAA